MKTNITQNISSKQNSKLHLQVNHPVEIIKKRIYKVFGSLFHKFENLSEVVNVTNNFDLLLIPQNHPSRKPTDTYYVDENTVLRTHTSAHQVELLRQGYEQFLVVGDCYRRDEIDSTHYPVFHQMEGVKIFKNTDELTVKNDLVETITTIIELLFPNAPYKLVDSYFPFTTPSYEVEVFWNNKWIEVLGCGLIHPDVMKNAGRENEQAWAFGLGLERLAMILFKIPDIRLFWSTDERFLNQFISGEIIEFKPYSKFPECYKDIAFWINEDYNYNDFCELVRDTGKDLVENVSLIDTFKHPKTGLTSHCYRVCYRSNERNLTNKEVNEMFFELQTLTSNNLHVKLRV